MGSGWLRVGIANINGPPDFGGWFQILAAHQRESLVGVGMANAGESLLGDFCWGDGKQWWETVGRLL